MTDQDNDRTREFAVLAEGSEVAHYRILKKLGAGGMGVVYLAEDRRLNRKVVLKFLSPQLADNRNFRTRFLREARSAASLSHPNIVTIYEVGETGNRPYIAMEYIEGRSLEDQIASGSVTSEQAVDIMLQLCEGLAEAHRAGIVHRDIKPGNIHIDSRGRVKILDFGLAKGGDDTQLTRVGATVGTVNYMSPEQGEGDEVDHRSDLFAAGVVFYELLTGQRPFRRGTPAATIHAVIHSAPRPLSELCSEPPPGAQAIVERALAKRRDKRYQTATDFRGDLERLKHGKPVEPAASPTTPEAVTSVAVLCLKNLGVPDDDFLSYGITEDLIVDLSRLGSLRVAPMRSVLPFRDSADSLDEIARKLKVSLLLDGSIHRSGEAIRVSAQLLDPAGDHVLWADRWQKPVESLPSIKQSLAEGISKALSIDTVVAEDAQVGKPETHDPDAYEFYLRGKYKFDHKVDKASVEVALGLYRKALELEPSLLAARTGTAEALMHQGRYMRAMDELKSALTDAANRQLKADEAHILQLLARACHHQSRWDQAWDYGDRARQLSRQLGDLTGESEALAVLIDVLEPQARYEEAYRLFERVLEINRLLDEHDKTAQALKGMGVIHHRKGEYDEALRLYQEALAICQEQENFDIQAKLLNNIGLISLNRGRLDEALKHFEQALSLHNRLDNPTGAIINVNNIAVVRYLRGEFRDALATFEKSLAMARRQGARKDEALALENVSKTRIILGEYERGMEDAWEALQLARELDYQLIVTTSLKNLADANAYMGNDDKAEELYHETLDAARKAELRAEEALVAAALAGFLFRQRRYDESREYAALGAKRAEQTGNAEYHILASIYVAANEAVSAQDEGGLEHLYRVYERAKEVRDPLLILTASRLLVAQLLSDRNDAKQVKRAHTLVNEALDLARKTSVAHEIRWLSELSNSPDHH
jgi:serine/threonine protein kinase/tetratricopeptide (TPR) repeat protein